MPINHILLAIAVTFFWGLNFIFIEMGLETTPPLLLAFYRFAISALAIFIFVRPTVDWKVIVILSLSMFVGQFAFVFVSLSLGTPPGLTSVLVQSQLIFTLVYVTILTRKLPTVPTLIGSGIALVGLVLICFGVGAGTDVSVLGLVLLFMAGASWGVGNVVLGRLGKIDMAGIVAWMSLAAIIPFALLSLIFEGPTVIGESFHRFDHSTVISIFASSAVSTIFCYWGWAWLIRHHGVPAVVPYSLLVPVSGILSAVIFWGEEIGLLRGLGIMLILAGLAVHSIWTAMQQKNN